VRFVKILGNILVISSLILILAITQGPNLVKENIENQIGGFLKRSVQIKNISVNPFLFSITISDLLIEKNFKIGTLKAQINIIPFLKNELNIEKIILKDTQLELFKINNQFLIKDLEEIFNNKSKKTGNKESEKEKGAFKTVLNLIQLKNIILKLPANSKLNLKAVKLTNLHLYPTKEKPLSIDISAIFNNSMIQINTTASNYFNSPIIKSNQLFKDFELSWLRPYIPKEIIQISGVMTHDSKIEYSDSSFKIKTSTAIKDLLVMTKNKKNADYFIKDLEISDLDLNKDKTLAILIKQIRINGLIFGEKINTIKSKKDWSRFSKISFMDIKLSKDPLLNFSTTYNEEASIEVSEKTNKNTKVLTAKVQSFDLTPFSEAFYPGLKYHIESGKMDLKYKAVHKNKNVNAKTNIILNHFSLDNRNEQGKVKGDKTNLSLPMALGIIKDDEGKIDLDFDFEGKEDDPSIKLLTLLNSGFGGIIVGKFQNIIGLKAANRFLPMLVKSIPFNPMNAYMVTKKGFQLITAPSFQDIEFKYHSDKIQIKSKKYLKTFTKFVKDNKAMKFKLCPLVTQSEGKTKLANKDSAIKLSAKRINILKKEFKKAKIQKQIIFCRPRIVDDVVKNGIVKIEI
jgi:hypothetical protein